MSVFLRAMNGKMINVVHVSSIAHAKDKGVQITYFDGTQKGTETAFLKLGADHVGIAADLALAASSAERGVLCVDTEGAIQYISGAGASPRKLNLQRFDDYAGMKKKDAV